MLSEETDYLCLQFIELEREMRERRQRLAAKPLFRSETPKGGRPKDTSDRTGARRRHQKKVKARYAECVANGICTICRRAKAENGRLCAKCREKEHERQKERNTERSERRAACRRKREAA